MKSFCILMLIFSLSSQVGANTESFNLTHENTQCSLTQTQGGDAWPWSVAQPFPWNNIEGYWKLGDQDELSYIKARITSTTSKRKILSLQVLGNGLCTKPTAKGTGFVDAAEKNVVRAILSDGLYQYQVLLGMFDMRDLTGKNMCTENIMAVSMQVVGRAKKANDNKLGPLDPSITGTHNMVLKKVTADVDELCKTIH